MEMITLLEFLLAFFDLKLSFQHTPKLPQEATVAQCYDWLAKKQTSIAQERLCGRSSNLDIMQYDFVLRGNRCDKVLSRSQAEQFVRNQAEFPLLQAAWDNPSDANAASPDTDAVKRYCDSTDQSQVDQIKREFDREAAKLIPMITD